VSRSRPDLTQGIGLSPSRSVRGVVNQEATVQPMASASAKMRRMDGTASYGRPVSLNWNSGISSVRLR
jgi:hypothetical protein